METNKLKRHLDNIPNIDFDIGKKCQFIPHYRKNAKPLLLYGFHLYQDTNVTSKTGTKYYRCNESNSGCCAVAHTKVNEEGFENRIIRGGRVSQVLLDGIQF